MEKKKVVLIAITVFVIVCVYFIFEFFVWRLDKGETLSHSEDYVVNDDLSASESEEEDKVNGNVTDKEGEKTLSDAENTMNEENLDEKIYVYVTGEVNNSGVVVLNEGARISDAIDAAGGVTSNADISKINLVYILSDGVKLNIPSFNALKENPDFEYIILGSGEGSLNSDGGNSSSRISSEDGTDSSSGKIGSGTGSSKQIVNINSASQTELELLPRYWAFTCS